MSGDAPFRPHHTGAELVLRLGPTAEVSVTVDDGWPIVEIAWGSIQLLLMPNTAAMGAPILPCDVERARDLHRASQVYLAALEARLAAQEANSITAVTVSAAASIGASHAPSGQRDGQAVVRDASAPVGEQLDGPTGPINLGRKTIHGGRGMAGSRSDGSVKAAVVPDGERPDRHGRAAA